MPIPEAATRCPHCRHRDPQNHGTIGCLTLLVALVVALPFSILWRPLGFVWLPLWLGLMYWAVTRGQTPSQTATAAQPSATSERPAPATDEFKPNPPEPAPVADEIRKLAALRDEGALSQEEFDHQKGKLLGD